jgi:hypothetical protein
MALKVARVVGHSTLVYVSVKFSSNEWLIIDFKLLME